MIQIQKLTTLYVPLEDRIRLTGAVVPQGSNSPTDQAPQTVAIWLTQRLLGRIVPSVLNWLETADSVARQNTGLQSFRQEAAKAEHKPQPPVIPNPDGPDGQSWVAQTIQFKSGPNQMRLEFAAGPETRAAVVLPMQNTRQWLGIVFHAYKAADWPLDIWPDWMKEAGSPPPPSGQSARH